MTILRVAFCGVEPDPAADGRGLGGRAVSIGAIAPVFAEDRRARSTRYLGTGE